MFVFELFAFVDVFILICLVLQWYNTYKERKFKPSFVFVYIFYKK